MIISARCGNQGMIVQNDKFWLVVLHVIGVFMLMFSEKKGLVSTNCCRFENSYLVNEIIILP